MHDCLLPPTKYFAVSGPQISWIEAFWTTQIQILKPSNNWMSGQDMGMDVLMIKFRLAFPAKKWFVVSSSRSDGIF